MRASAGIRTMRILMENIHTPLVLLFFYLLLSKNQASADRTSLTCSFDSPPNISPFCGWQTLLYSVRSELMYPYGGAGSVVPVSYVNTVYSEKVAPEFKSPLIYLAKPTQFSFYYRLEPPPDAVWSNTTPFGLQLIQQPEQGPELVVTLWRAKKNYEHSRQWLPVRVTLCHRGWFRLRFVISREKIYRDIMMNVGIYNIVLNDEATTVYNTAVQTLAPALSQDHIRCDGADGCSNSVTCAITNISSSRLPAADYCGWKLYPADEGITVGLVSTSAATLTGNPSIISGAATLIATRKSTAVSALTRMGFVVRSQRVRFSSLWREFSFSYRLEPKGQSIGSLIVSDGLVSQAVLTLNSSSWSVPMPAYYSFNQSWPANETEYLTFSFNITFAENSEGLFALDDVWYSGEPCFQPNKGTSSLCPETTIVCTDISTTLILTHPTNVSAETTTKAVDPIPQIIASTSTTGVTSEWTPAQPSASSTGVNESPEMTTSYPVKPEQMLFDDLTSPVKDSPLSEDLIGWITAGTVGLVMLVTIVVFLLVRRRKRPTHDETERQITLDPLKCPSTQYPDVLRNNDDKIEVIPAETVEIGNVLGRGEYGIVYQGLARSLLTVPKGPTVVAVKCITDLASQEQNQLLVEEYKVMLKVGKHVNVLDILGIIWDKFSPSFPHNPPFLVLEYCPFGSLRGYLRDRSYWDGLVYSQIDQNGELQVVEENAMNDKFLALCARERIEADERNKKNFLLSNVKLMNFIGQICRGMQYLHSRNVIHRDLAARNILVADGCILKICDFGLARHAEGFYTVSNVFVALPILWMPPEAILTREFCNASDVWSFGIVLWEIFSLGQIPFHRPDVARFSANAFAEWLMAGNQMVRPNLCPLKTYEMMLSCWYIRREDRPTFSHLLEKLMEDYLPLEDRPVGTFDQFNAATMNHLIEDRNL